MLFSLKALNLDMVLEPLIVTKKIFQNSYKRRNLDHLVQTSYISDTKIIS